MLTSLFLTSTLLTASTIASPLHSRQTYNTVTAPLNVTAARWDGQCFYPEPDDDFELSDYLGRWYQVAGTVAPFTAGCKCVYAEYALNVSLDHFQTQTDPRSLANEDSANIFRTKY